jgi:hypothetical protein
VGRLNDVLSALANAVDAAINAAGITNPNQVGIGKPNYEDLTKIISAGQMQVTLYTDTSGVRNTTRFFPSWQVKTPLNVTLSAVVSGNAVTFSGAVPTSGPQFNVHTLVGSPLQDVLVQTVPGDTLASIAVKVVAGINGLPGMTATANGNGFTVSGSANLICNVGGTATLAQEVSRISRLVDVTIYTADPDLRAAVEDAVLAQVGTVAASRLVLPDGTKVWCRYHTSGWVDDKQLDYSIYESHVCFTMEYGVLQTQTATQIGAIETTLGNLTTGVNQSPVYEG